jgi:hypothetical protein
MRCFLKNFGFLMIISGVVLLFFLSTLNRVENMHYAIAGILEIAGLILYILTNKYFHIKEDHC